MMDNKENYLVINRNANYDEFDLDDDMIYENDSYLSVLGAFSDFKTAERVYYNPPVHIVENTVVEIILVPFNQPEDFLNIIIKSRLEKPNGLD